MTNNTPRSDHAITNLVFRAGTEFVSGIMVGVIFGLGIDYLFSSKPVGLIVMILLGAAAGFRNIFRVVKRAFPQGKINHQKEKIEE